MFRGYIFTCSETMEPETCSKYTTFCCPGVQAEETGPFAWMALAFSHYMTYKLGECPEPALTPLLTMPSQLS